MNKQKNKLTKAISYLTLLFLGLITVSATASADSIVEWIYGDTFMWVAIILGCVIVLALIGLYIYAKIKSSGLSMLMGKTE